MPVAPADVPTVTDPELLELADAGANWSCVYCRSAQRDLDGNCAQCGAQRAVPPLPQAASPTTGPATPAAAQTPAAPPSPAAGCFLIVVLLAMVFGLGTCAYSCVSCVGGSKTSDQEAPKKTSRVRSPSPSPSPSTPRTEFQAVVEDVSWARSSTLQRWQLVGHEDFADALPQGATSVRAIGQHIHHYDDVFDHNETVYDDVEVPYGYRTESYTESVECGKDCSTSRRTCKKRCSGSPKSCKEVCSNKKNGFASCKTVCTGGDERCEDVCTGGDRTCTPKYCNERRTRKVPKTRTEKRSRVEARYRKEPRYATWSAYQTWEWADLEKQATSGHDTSPTWPAHKKGGARPVVGLSDTTTGKAGAEREVRTETLSVTFRTDDGAFYFYTPSPEEPLSSFSTGSRHEVTVSGGRLTLRH